MIFFIIIYKHVFGQWILFWVNHSSEPSQQSQMPSLILLLSTNTSLPLPVLCLQIKQNQSIDSMWNDRRESEHTLFGNYNRKLHLDRHSLQARRFHPLRNHNNRHSPSSLEFSFRFLCKRIHYQQPDCRNRSLLSLFHWKENWLKCNDSMHEEDRLP